MGLDGVFERQDEPKPSFWSRLLRRAEPALAEAQIRNFLASGQIPGHEDVQAILHRCRVKSGEIQDVLGRIFQHYLLWAVRDRNLDDSEIETIQRLREVLRLRDQTLHRIVGGALQQELVQAFSDGEFSDSEREALSKTYERLTLPDEVVKSAVEGAKQAVLDRTMSGAIQDLRLSPEEDAELKKLSTNLGIDFEHDAELVEELNRMRSLWCAENGELVPVEVDVRLYQGEICYFQGPAEWAEHGKETVRYNYSGPTLRVKIAKGLAWRAGSIQLKPLRRDVLRTVDEGRVFITERRVLFVGRTRSSTTRLDRVVDFERYAEGVEVRKDRGKSLLFLMEDSADVFCAVLGRAIEELS